MKKWLLVLSVLLTSCQPTSLEEFQVEGEVASRALIKDLRKIETREDLSLLEASLKKDFHRLVDVMIQARAFQMKNPEADPSFQTVNALLNEALLDELKRVYALEGGREVVERAAREAMLRLDSKEKMFKVK